MARFQRFLIQDLSWFIHLLINKKMANNLVQSMFDALVHVGHKAEFWNPKMKPFLFAKKKGVWVFDLEKSADHLDKAEKFLKAIKLQNKKVLFVGTKPQAAYQIEKLIAGKGHYYVDKKWTPGLLTNFKELRRRIDHYLTLKSQFETGEINKYTKKEVAGFRKDLDKLHASYGGVAEMRSKPDVVIVLDAVVDRLAIDEAVNAKIATIAILDANANPDGVDFPIPGNDDALKSLDFLVNRLLDCLA